MDTRLALMCGTDIPIPQCKLVIHQPSIKDISMLGEKDFFSGVQCLCLNKSMFIEDKSLLDTTTNFQIFMTVMSEPKARQKKESTKSVLQLLFPDYKILFTPNSLIFKKENEEDVLIDDSNFEILQFTLKDIFCQQDGPMDQHSFNPVNDKAKEIADKIMKGRQKVAEEKGSANASIFSQYLSMLTIGIHIPLEELIKMTMFQLYDLIERFMLYINWDIDLRARIAGAKPEEHPDNWMKNIH